MFDLRIISSYKEKLYTNPEQLLLWLETNSNNGNSTATYLLAMQYAYCYVTYKNLDKTYQIIKKLYESDCIEGYLGMADCYFFGYGVNENNERAFELYNEVLKKEPDNYGALCKIGRMYRCGWGVDKDIEKAFQILSAAAQNGSARAATELGWLYEFDLEHNAQNISKALQWYQYGADRGDALGARKLAYAYEEGLLGLPQNSSQAFYWYNHAREDYVALSSLADECWGDENNLKSVIAEILRRAEYGDANLQNTLGYLYAKSIGLPHDVDKAIYWYKKALENGDGYAGYRLACAYLSGWDGFPKDVHMAYDIFIKAAEKGESLAMEELGNILDNADLYDMNWISCEERENQALYWYEKAAGAGETSAAFSCALKYLYGSYSIPKDYDKAEYYYTICADNGNSMAYLPIAELNIEKGIKNPDYSKAQEYINLILYPVAQPEVKNDYEIGKAEYLLGKMYEDGLGVISDINEAIRHYQKAVDMGIDEAKDAMKKYKGTFWGWKRI